MWRVIRILSIQFILSNLILKTTEDAEGTEDWGLGLLPACAKLEPPALPIIPAPVLRPRLLITMPADDEHAGMGFVCRVSIEWG